MSFKKISDLRKAGKLQEALMMAEAGLQAAPDYVWNKRAYAWVGYDFLKKAAENNDLQEMVRWIEEIKKLGLTAEDNMVYDSIAWAAGKFLFTRDKVYADTLNTLFALIREFPFSRPGQAYSYLLKAFRKHAEEWQAFPAFLEWWGTEHFLPADYEGFITDTGRRLISPVESVLITVSKHLLAQPEEREQTEKFIPWIAGICRKHKNMLYPPYYYARLLLALGDRKQFFEAFLPFARKKKREFWVWDLLGEAFDKDSNEYLSCLCKALTCGAPGKFTVNVKEKLAGVFEAKEEYPRAKREYLDILEVRNEEGWPLKEKHLKWEEKAWWKDTEPVTDNPDYYRTHHALAESLLFAGQPETLIVVDHVNREKQVFSFVALQEQYGFIHYGRLDADPEPGTVYAVRFKEPEPDIKSNFRKVYTLRTTDQRPGEELMKTVTGKLLIRPGNSFGFVEDVFIPEPLIRKNNLVSGRIITVEALRSFNRKKKDWGWKGVKIDNPV